MDRQELLHRACETNADYLALGNERFEARDATFIRNRTTPHRHDANSVQLIRSDSPSDFKALLRQVETEYAGMAHRMFGVDALTPSSFVARLVLEDGYKHDQALVHVLEGPLQGAPRDVELREVLTDEDWQAYRELDAMWWQESSVDTLGPYNSAHHDEHMVYRRIKAPRTRGWFACVDGAPRAFLSSWPGDNGIGIVEDLFCHPEYRHRGLATALIARAVADCRERGAGPVIINSDPASTPKHLYAAMGFRPLFVTRTYTKQLQET